MLSRYVIRIKEYYTVIYNHTVLPSKARAHTRRSRVLSLPRGVGRSGLSATWMKALCLSWSLQVLPSPFLPAPKHSTGSLAGRE